MMYNINENEKSINDVHLLENWRNKLYNKKGFIRKEKYYKTFTMCTFIKMEDVVASALVELYDKDETPRVSFDTIRSYGFKVEEFLIKQNINAILLYSNNYAKEFLDDYSQFFERDGDYICLRDGVTSQQIRDRILSYVSIDVLSALLNNEILSAITNVAH